MGKIVIVGAGISGLSAGIYAAKAGFEVEIYEKNNVAGGCCSAWKRGSYTIDNCIHWLTGTKAGTPQHKVWTELGVIKEGETFIERESFYTTEYEGQTITLWRDLERTKNELLEMSPDDVKEINKFIECVKFGESLQIPKDNPSDKDNAYNDVNIPVSRVDVARTLIGYAGMTMGELALKFKHPLLQKMMTDFMAKDYEAYWLVVAYSFFVAGNGDILKGGSGEIVKRLVDTYLELGGKLYLNKTVGRVILGKRRMKINKQILAPKKINFYKMKKIMAKKAEGICLKDGTFISADYIICACDIHYTYHNLIDKKYFPKSLRRAYQKSNKYVVYSSFQVAFAVDGEMEELNDTLSFECDTLDVGMESYNRITLKNYRNYGDYIAPKGKTVIQCSIVQYLKDYNYWEKLRKTPGMYEQCKNNVAQAILYRIEKKFPQYIGKLHILDIWTPHTYKNRNNCYAGAYMRFVTTATSPKAFLSNDVKKLANVYLANHWIRYPGGVPTAAAMGKVVVDRINNLQNS